MKKRLPPVFQSRFGLLALVVLLAAINILAARLHTRVDLTAEKRYTLSNGTVDLLKRIDDDVQINVFLKGDLNSGFRKLANSTDEFLELLKDRNSSHIHYNFISPEDEVPGTNVLWGDTLRALGAIPINLTAQVKAGQTTNIIFPVAQMIYKGQFQLINLYPVASAQITQSEINSAEALMEYQFANALDKLTQEKKPTVAYAVGNGEPTDQRTYDMVQSMRDDYRFGMLDLVHTSTVPKEVDVLLLVKPTIQFSDAQKFAIDQFVMRGGKLLCFIDALNAEQDSLAYGKKEIIAFDRDLNLTDLFFRYGVRINTDLVMDLRCDVLPFVVGGTPDQPQFEYLPWNYYPFLSPASSLNKSIGYVRAQLANSIDTISVANVKKTPLLVSSPNSRTIATPALISPNENRVTPQDDKFNRQDIPVAMLLEGDFVSAFKNRVSRDQQDTLAAHGEQFNGAVKNNKMIIVSDGDIVFNEFDQQAGPLPMGWNHYTFAEYQQHSSNSRYFVQVANRQFFLNSLEYLVKDAAISQTRNKDIVLRLLDARKLEAGEGLWRFINIAVPILLVVLAGLIYQQVRKRKYAR